MSIRYVVINLEDEDEYSIFSTIRELTVYLNEMYLMSRSHMYFQRNLKDNDKLYIDSILIHKIVL